MRPWMLGLVLLVMEACGPAELSGSLGNSVDLSYARAELLLEQDQLSLVFLRPTEDREGNNVPLRLVVKVRGASPQALDLTEVVEGGAQRGVFFRAVEGEAPVDFPRLEVGHLWFNKKPAPGVTTGGSFGASFAAVPGFAGGQNVFGDFTARAR